MNKKELQMIGFEIVAYSGDARSELLKLLRELREGKPVNLEHALQEVDTNLNLAHQAQTKILQQEALGENLDLGFIFIHGQDHLMTTLLLREVIQDFVALYNKR